MYEDPAHMLFPWIHVSFYWALATVDQLAMNAAMPTCNERRYDFGKGSGGVIFYGRKTDVGQPRF